MLACTESDSQGRKYEWNGVSQISIKLSRTYLLNLYLVDKELYALMS